MIDLLSVAVAGCERYRANADFSQINKPFSIFQHKHSTIHVASVLWGEPKPLPTAKAERLHTPDDIEYAEYGLSGSDDRSQWISVTATGGRLSGQVKHLLGVVSPIELNPENLKLSHDPAPGRIKTLKIRLRDGVCLAICDGDKVSFSSATKCDPFLPDERQTS
jgi:hypothetical protein